MEVSKSDIRDLVRYLNDAAVLYDAQGWESVYSNRARLLRNMAKKLHKKVS